MWANDSLWFNDIDFFGPRRNVGAMDPAKDPVTFTSIDEANLYAQTLCANAVHALQAASVLDTIKQAEVFADSLAVIKDKNIIESLFQPTPLRDAVISELAQLFYNRVDDIPAPDLAIRASLHFEGNLKTPLVEFNSSNAHYHVGERSKHILAYLQRFMNFKNKFSLSKLARHEKLAAKVNAIQFDSDDEHTLATSAWGLAYLAGIKHAKKKIASQSKIEVRPKPISVLFDSEMRVIPDIDAGRRYDFLRRNFCYKIYHFCLDILRADFTDAALLVSTLDKLLFGDNRNHINASRNAPADVRSYMSFFAKDVEAVIKDSFAATYMRPLKPTPPIVASPEPSLLQSTKLHDLPSGVFQK